jgi:hypothetical protein
MPAHHELGEHIALVEIVDRVLGKGAVIAGEMVLAVAEVELVRLELQVVLGTVDALAPRGTAQTGKAVSR